MKKITARFTKTFVSGYLRGISERQSLTFNSISAAEFDDSLVIDGARISWFWLGNVKRD